MAPTVEDVLGDGRLLKEVVVEGLSEERPRPGEEVVVEYTGSLESDGSVFASSQEDGEPFRFMLGQGDVIEGWDRGIATNCNRFVKLNSPNLPGLLCLLGLIWMYDFILTRQACLGWELYLCLV